MLTVGVKTAAGRVEVTLVAEFDYRPKIDLTILSTVSITAKAFIPFIHAWIILTGTSVETWGRATSIDWKLAFFSAPIFITITFVSLFWRIVLAAAIQARIRIAILFLFLAEISFISRITNTEVARRRIDAGAVVAAEIRRTKIDFLLAECTLVTGITITEETRYCTGLIEAFTVATTPGRGRAVVDRLPTTLAFVSFSALAFKSFVFLIVDAKSVVLARVRRAVVDGKRRVVTWARACSIVVFHKETTLLITLSRVITVLVEAAAALVTLFLGLFEALLAIIISTALIIMLGAVGHVVLVTGTVSIALAITLTFESSLGHARRDLGVKLLGKILVVLDLDHASAECITDGIHGIVVNGAVLLPLIGLGRIDLAGIQCPSRLGITFSIVTTGRGVLVTMVGSDARREHGTIDFLLIDDLVILERAVILPAICLAILSIVAFRFGPSTFVPGLCAITPTARVLKAVMILNTNLERTAVILFFVFIVLKGEVIKEACWVPCVNLFVLTGLAAIESPGCLALGLRRITSSGTIDGAVHVLHTRGKVCTVVLRLAQHRTAGPIFPLPVVTIQADAPPPL